MDSIVTILLTILINGIWTAELDIQQNVAYSDSIRFIGYICLQI